MKLTRKYLLYIVNYLIICPEIIIYHHHLSNCLYLILCLMYSVYLTSSIISPLDFNY